MKNPIISSLTNKDISFGDLSHIKLFLYLIELEKFKNLENLNSIEEFKKILDRLNSRDKFIYKEAFVPVGENKRRFLYHLSSGGFGAVFILNETIIKLVCSHKILPNEYCVPHMIKDTLIYSNPKLEYFFVLPSTCIVKSNLKYLWKALYNIYSLYLLCFIYRLLYIEKKESNKNTKVSISEIINRNKSYNEMSEEDIKILKQIIKEQQDFVHQMCQIINEIYKIDICIISNHLSFYRLITSILAKPEQEQERGYIMILPYGICSSNKITTNNELSNLFMFQILLFYYMITDIFPNFAHGDLKMDNIIMFHLTGQNLKFNININRNIYVVNINSPVIFKITDFDDSNIKSADNLWKQDLHFLLHSIQYYNNFKVNNDFFKFFMPCIKNHNLCKSWKIEPSVFTYTRETLGNLILDKFPNYISKKISILESLM